MTHLGVQGRTGAYRGIQGRTGAYRGVQGRTGAYRGVQGRTGAYRGVQGRTGASRDKSLENDFAALFVGRGCGGVKILRIFFKLIFKYNIKFINNINKHCRICMYIL